MSAPDIYAGRTHDDAGDPLCNLPEPSAPVSIARATVPSFDFSTVAVDLCRTAAAKHLAGEYAHEIRN